MSQDPGPTGTATERAHALAGSLVDWLPRQRWYAGKGRPVTGVVPIRALPLVTPSDVDSPNGTGGPTLDQVVVELRYADGGPPERYQVFVGYLPVLPERLEHVRIGALGAAGPIGYDGLWDDELADRLLGLIAAGRSVDGLRAVPEPAAGIRTGLPSRVVDAEQSNTSVVYDEAAILKVFRRLVPGRNPDVELNRALRRAGSGHVAELLGEIEGELSDQPVCYAMLSSYAANSAEGWAMATASVRDLFAEEDLRADEVGGDFAGEAERLGEAVASVHADLAAELGTGTLAGPGYAELAAGMVGRLSVATEIVPELAGHADQLRAAFGEVAELTEPCPTQRIHGDLHLGQVLRTPTAWLIIDFEGEPVKPLTERLRPDSPLRDVAGMLRSFDYAAAQFLVSDPAAQQPDHQLEFRAREWADRNRAAFRTGYAAAGPVDPDRYHTLLRAYELDKAVYEAVYETRHRPAWRDIPLRSITWLLADEPA